MAKGICCHCGSKEFITEPNRYDVLQFEDDELQVVSTELLDDFKIYCRDCSAEINFNH